MSNNRINVPLWFYHQAGALPYRYIEGQLEILLITSLRKKRWIIPKGVVDPGDTQIETAQKEAYEEAGIRGILAETSMGSYGVKKWGGECIVNVFPMEVTTMLESWPEIERTRQWMGLIEAIKAIEEPGLQRLVQLLPDWLVNKK